MIISAEPFVCLKLLHYFHSFIFTGLQEATSELVTTLNNNIEESQKKKQLEEKMSATTKDSSPTDAVGFTSEPFEFEYTFKVSTKVFLL